MESNIDELLVAALELPEADRVELAERLVASIGEERLSEIKRSWADEVECRLAAFDQGSLEAIPADDVFRQLSSRKSQ
jgi:putative addiction module component (TIGR02574 family)